MRISDWSSDVCSSDLLLAVQDAALGLADVAVGGLRRLALRLVEHLPDVGEVEPLALGDEDDGIGLVVRQALADVLVLPRHVLEIGRASCRERVCPYV